MAYTHYSSGFTQKRNKRNLNNRVNVYLELVFLQMILRPFKQSSGAPVWLPVDLHWAVICILSTVLRMSRKKMRSGLYVGWKCPRHILNFAMFTKLNIHSAYSCNIYAKKTEIFSDNTVLHRFHLRCSERLNSSRVIDLALLGTPCNNYAG